jgi:hypothetical protein
MATANTPNPDPDDHAAWEARIREINADARQRKAERFQERLEAERRKSGGDAR